MTPILSAFTLEAIVAYKQFKVLCVQHAPALLAVPAPPTVVPAVPVKAAAVPAPVAPSKLIALASRVEVEVFLDGVDVIDSTWDAWEDTLAEYALAA